MAIKSITATQRLDSRGNPTVQTRIVTSNGTFTSLVPSGASKGDYEAVELRDGDDSIYHGNSVLKAVRNVNEILGPAVCKAGLDPATELKRLDELMIKLDGSNDKGNLGANAILSISMALARAGAAARNIPLYEYIAAEAGLPTDNYVLPVPFFNVLNGGDHSGNSMAFQEFMIAPVGASSTSEAVQFAAETYASLKSVIVAKSGKSAIGIGDEGGFAPPIYHPCEALELLTQAIEDAGHTGKICIGIDPASQSFFEHGSYNIGFKTETPESLQPSELAQMYRSLMDSYPIILLEDPFGQDDWQSFVEFNKDCPIELVGDDLLATNITRIKMAKDKGACNSLLLKINQIGTISEAIAAAKEAYAAEWSVFVSHRSGETTDDFIADLTVGLRTGHLKSGAPCRGERVAKYNRLMDIEDELGDRQLPFKYAGPNLRHAQKL
ncbi:enolase [Aureobasidium pullulans]|nr:enolase [Aureobasidium pullulans]THW58843.1 enolase [Aureobasidium pullulans]THW89981.1 enolase [Aureobasidium pullulans]THX94775.1 enolase [Aureobasidium pullulans]THY55419.1 enolase [Aureobasidium pullulans]